MYVCEVALQCIGLIPLQYALCLKYICNIIVASVRVAARSCQHLLHSDGGPHLVPTPNPAWAYLDSCLGLIKAIQFIRQLRPLVFCLVLINTHLPYTRDSTRHRQTGTTMLGWGYWPMANLSVQRQVLLNQAVTHFAVRKCCAHSTATPCVCS
jgi:hypothetical protein